MSGRLFFPRTRLPGDPSPTTKKKMPLRVTVKPKAADIHNALTYDFDNLQRIRSG